MNRLCLAPVKSPTSPAPLKYGTPTIVRVFGFPNDVSAYASRALSQKCHCESTVRAFHVGFVRRLSSVAHTVTKTKQLMLAHAGTPLWNPSGGVPSPPSIFCRTPPNMDRSIFFGFAFLWHKSTGETNGNLTHKEPPL